MPSPFQLNKKISLIPTLILTLACSISELTHAEEAVITGNWCGTRDTSMAADCDAIFRVDLVTGKRTLLSAYVDEVDYESLDQGGISWEKVAITPSGDVFVYSRHGHTISQGLYRIDPTNGDRRLISDLDDIKLGPTMLGGENIVASPKDQILIVNSDGKIISINPASGQRSVLLDNRIGDQSPGAHSLIGIATDGRILVDTYDGVIYLDQNTEISALAGGITANELSVIDSTGNIFTIVGDEEMEVDFDLYKVSPNGIRSILSKLKDKSQGPVIVRPVGVALDKAGRILILEYGEKGTGGLYAIDPNSGKRVLISMFSNQNQGPLIFNPRAIAVGTMPTFAGIAGGDRITNVAQAKKPFTYNVGFKGESFEITKVNLSNRLPKGAILKSVLPSQGTCKGKAPVKCNFGTVAPQARFGVKFTIVPKKPGVVVKNNAVITYKLPKTKAKQRLVSNLSITVN